MLENHEVNTSVKEGRFPASLERASVRWLAEHAAYLDPMSCAPADSLFRRKALVEVALLVAYRVRLLGPQLPADYLRLLSQLERIAKRPEYVSALGCDQRALLLYALTFAALRVCGRPVPAGEWVVKKSLELGYSTVTERIPYRRMDLLHMLHVAGLDAEAGKKLDQTFDLTLAAARPNLLLMSQSDHYALSHAVFYLTDFGLRRGSPRADLREVTETVLGALRLSLAKANTDLCAEFICCALALGARDAREVRAGWALLRARQHALGYVPGPDGIVLSATSDAEGTWKTSYHTTVVAALAGLMQQCQSLVETRAPSLGATVDAEMAPSELIEAVRSAQVLGVGWCLEQVSGESELREGCRALATACLGVMTGQVGLFASPSVRAFVDRLGESTPDWGELGADTLMLLALGLEGLPCPEVHGYAAQLESALPEAEVKPDAASLALRLVGVKKGRWSAERALAFRAARTHSVGTVAALSAEAAGHIDEYRLPSACATLELLGEAAGPRDRLLADGLRWVLSQQAMDGSFGHVLNQGAARGAKLACTAAALRLLTRWLVSNSVGPGSRG